jgi:hypothetical protein
MDEKMQCACLSSCCFHRLTTVSDSRCLRHNSAIVRSPRNAARATFALNSALNFRGFAIGTTSSHSGYPHSPPRPVFGAQYRART